MKARIEKLSIPVPESGCWIWIGSTTPRGYGKITERTGVTCYAHRASWNEFRGSIPEGMYVCHKCDTPQCVNPDHLFIGTPSDNSMDMHAKGRRPRKSKLTENQVLEIRSTDGTCKELGMRFGISKSAISLIKRGKIWKGENGAKK